MSRRKQMNNAHSNPATRQGGFLISSPLRDSLEFMGATDSVPTLEEVKLLFQPPMTIGTPERVRAAMDEQLQEDGFYNLLHHSIEMGMYSGMSNFMGYGALQGIAQNGLIRACIETVSDDMTRNWIELKREGDSEEKDEGEEKVTPKKPMVALPHGVERPEEKQAQDAQAEGMDDEKLFSEIMAELKRLDIQKVFHDAASMVGYYGGCLLFLDTGIEGEDLRNPLNLDPKHSSEAKNRGFLKAVRVLDPINVFPGSYNSTNPLAGDYFRPKTWWILGQEVHASRLLRLVANEAPLVYKPNYNFLGIPQAQILWDYVLHFQSNRDSLNRMMGKFSLTVFKTSMADILNGNANNLAMMDARMQILARNKSNDGVFAIDKDAEDVVNVTSTMTGMTDVVRQSLEILAALNRTPAVKLLGISPSGFNATGESDLRNYYDHVLSQQEKVLRSPLQTLIDIVQISLFGRVDSKISFDFKALSEEDESSSTMNQQTKVNTLMALLDRNVISPEEVRTVLANDPKSGLDNIDPEAVPDPQGGEGEDPMGGMGGMLGKPGMPGAPEGPDMGGMMPGGPEAAAPQGAQIHQMPKMPGMSQDQMLAMDEQKWITIGSKGEDRRGESHGGSHVLIDSETGKILGGLGGQYTGKTIDQMKKISKEQSAYGKGYHDAVNGAHAGVLGALGAHLEQMKQQEAEQKKQSQSDILSVLHGQLENMKQEEAKAQEEAEKQAKEAKKQASEQAKASMDPEVVKKVESAFKDGEIDWEDMTVTVGGTPMPIPDVSTMTTSEMSEAFKQAKKDKKLEEQGGLTDMASYNAMCMALYKEAGDLNGWGNPKKQKEAEPEPEAANPAATTQDPAQPAPKSVEEIAASVGGSLNAEGKFISSTGVSSFSTAEEFLANCEGKTPEELQNLIGKYTDLMQNNADDQTAKEHFGFQVGILEAALAKKTQGEQQAQTESTPAKKPSEALNDSLTKNGFTNENGIIMKDGEIYGATGHFMTVAQLCQSDPSHIEAFQNEIDMDMVGDFDPDFVQVKIDFLNNLKAMYGEQGATTQTASTPKTTKDIIDDVLAQQGLTVNKFGVVSSGSNNTIANVKNLTSQLEDAKQHPETIPGILQEIEDDMNNPMHKDNPYYQLKKGLFEALSTELNGTSSAASAQGTTATFTPKTPDEVAKSVGGSINEEGKFVTSNGDVAMFPVQEMLDMYDHASVENLEYMLGMYNKDLNNPSVSPYVKEIAGFYKPFIEEALAKKNGVTPEAGQTAPVPFTPKTPGELAKSVGGSVDPDGNFVTSFGEITYSNAQDIKDSFKDLSKEELAGVLQKDDFYVEVSANPDITKEDKAFTKAVLEQMYEEKFGEKAPTATGASSGQQDPFSFLDNVTPAQNTQPAPAPKFDDETIKETLIEKGWTVNPDGTIVNPSGFMSNLPVFKSVDALKQNINGSSIDKLKQYVINNEGATGILKSLHVALAKQKLASEGVDPGTLTASSTGTAATSASSSGAPKTYADAINQTLSKHNASLTPDGHFKFGDFESQTTFEHTKNWIDSLTVADLMKAKTEAEAAASNPPAGKPDGYAEYNKFKADMFEQALKVKQSSGMASISKGSFGIVAQSFKDLSHKDFFHPLYYGMSGGIYYSDGHGGEVKFFDNWTGLKNCGLSELQHNIKENEKMIADAVASGDKAKTQFYTELNAYTKALASTLNTSSNIGGAHDPKAISLSTTPPYQMTAGTPYHHNVSPSVSPSKLNANIQQFSMDEAINPSIASHQAVQISPKATKTELAAGKWYTGSDYADLNKALIHGYSLSPTQAQKVKQLDSFLSKTEASEHMILYRGMKLSQDEYDGNYGKMGNVVPIENYSSATTSFQTAESFCGHNKHHGMFEVHVPKGTNCASLMDISKFGASEQEILLPRGVKWKTIGYKKINGYNVTVVELSKD